MRVAGGAPRGLRAHQKPLQICDRCRTLTHLPKIKKIHEKTSTEATKKARKGGTATQARPGTHQANPTGRRQGKRPEEQSPSHQHRLTNIFLSSGQMWPKEQENFKLGHQNRPVIVHRLPSQHVRNYRSRVYHLNTPIKTPTDEQKTPTLSF